MEGLDFLLRASDELLGDTNPLEILGVIQYSFDLVSLFMFLVVFPGPIDAIMLLAEQAAIRTPLGLSSARFSSDNVDKMFKSERVSFFSLNASLISLNNYIICRSDQELFRSRGWETSINNISQSEQRSKSYRNQTQSLLYYRAVAALSHIKLQK